MKSSACFSGIVLVGTLVTTMHAETADEQQKSRLIPLKEIWAYKMPHTKDVWQLEPDNFGANVRDLGSEEQTKRYKKSLTFQIVNQLGTLKPTEPAPFGFVVSGKGFEALRETHSVLVDGKKPSEVLPAQHDLSLVFFSKAFDYYVHLDEVEIEPDKIKVRYFFVPHRGDGTSHFALISLGKLPQGKVEVDFVRSPQPDSEETAGFGAPPAKTFDAVIVCRPFTFTVKEDVSKSAR